MNLYPRRFLAFVSIAALSLSSTACAYSGGPIEGKVLEEATDKPIAGAIVVVRCEGTAFSFVESPTVCIHVESATTDKDGRYRIPAWRASAKPWSVHGIEPIVTAYKAGYQWPKRPPKSLGDEVQYLTPFRGTRGRRLEFLERVLDATRCGSQNDSEKNLHALFFGMYEEAKGIAVSRDDAEIVDTLRYWASFVLFDKNKPATRDAKGRLINVDQKGE
jgi:hypothetical protein